MFNSAGLSSSLSLGKVLGGISKTLGIANQIIPLYKEVKPVINNAKSAMAFFKEYTKSTKKGSTTKQVMNENINKTLEPEIKEVKYINKKGPTFFL